MPDRQTIFEQSFEEYDEKALTKVVKFPEHRFISVERDALTGHRYVMGHRSLRGACSHMARTMEEGDPYVPEFVLDLDSGTRHEIDVFAFVAPRSVEAVALLMPREAAEAALAAVAASAAGGPMEQALQIIRQVLDRRKPR